MMLLLSLFMVACRDEVAPLAQRYDALIAAGASPDQPAFDVLLGELESVSPRSTHAPRAQRLAAAIRAGRATRVRAPLARTPKEGSSMPDALKAQLARCAALAAEVGRDGGLAADGLALLEACRAQADRLDAEGAHGDEAH